MVLRLLNQDQFAELIGLMRLALADSLGVCLEDSSSFPSALVLPRKTRSRV